MTDIHPTTTPEEVYLTPAQVALLIPGMTKAALAQLRYRGLGPTYLKPTAKLVLYRRDDVIHWLERSAFTSTREVA